VRVLVFGGWFGSGNLGDDAILIRVKEVMRMVIPNIKLTALSVDPARTRTVCGVDAIKLSSPKQIMKSPSSFLRMFKDFEAIIVTGGTPIYDYDHVSRVLHMGLPAIQGKPLNLFGVGAKPLYTVKGRQILRMLLKKATLISVRDVPSRDTLSEVTCKPITLTGDSALFVKRKIKNEKLDRPTAVFCPRVLSLNNRLLYHDLVSPSQIRRIRASIARTADFLHETHNVLFLPFHIEGLDDDRCEIEAIRSLMKNKETKIVDYLSSPMEALGFFQQADIIVGERLHSLVLGALQGVPLVTVSYDRKIQGFMDMVGLNEYVYQPETIGDSLTAKVSEALENTSDIRDRIKVSIRSMKRRIIDEAIKLGEMLNLS
jgi:polysaccharide pyruvyl transferase WcaK-like protein